MARPGWYNENSGRDFPFVFSREDTDPDVSTFRGMPDVIVDFGCIVGAHGDFVEGEHSVWLEAIERYGNYVEFIFYSDAPGLAGHKLAFTRELSDDDYEVEHTTAVSRDAGSLSISAEAPAVSYCSGDVLWEGFLVTKNVAKVTTVLPAPAQQSLRPDGDTLVSGFVPDGAPGDIYPTIDDDPWNDSSFSRSDYSIGTAEYRCSLSNPSQIPNEDDYHTLYWRGREGTKSPDSCIVELRQGPTTVLAQWSYDEYDLTSLWKTFTEPLTAAQAAAITDYNDLQVYLKVTGSPGGPQHLIEVSEVELKVPTPVVLSEVALGNELIVEPGLIRNLSGHYLNAVNVFNANRTRAERVTGCKPWCWSSAAYTTYDNFPVATCLAGDIRLAEGYNCFIEEDQYNSKLTIHAESGLGLGEPPEEIPIFGGELPPVNGSYLDGSIGCEEVIRSINGIEGPHVEIVGGQGVSVDTIPGSHLIVIKVDMQDLTGCFEQEASTSLSEAAPNTGPCDCGEATT